jgi:membrane-bound lytic murein transglycosylase D
MGIIRSIINKVFITVCCISVLSACAPVKTGDLDREHRTQESASAENNKDFIWGLSNNYPPIESSTEQEEMLQGDIEPEPEQTKAQELKDLKLLGKWEEGVPAVEYSDEEVTYDFPVTVNRQVQYYLDFFTGKHRDNFARWLSRSGRYLPMINEHLRAAGLPEDLAYLAMIESGYNERAYSRARAVGVWQFIRATGRNYGLEINTYVDERRDPVKSTQAAVSYLGDLYSEFGSWYLAVAAYNAGEGKIRRAIKKYNTTDFWEIAQGRYLKLETKRYVPKLIAAIIIAKEPEKYGFDNIEYEPPLAYETVEVPRWTALKAVALSCEMEPDDLKKYNNHLRKGFTPPDKASYPFKVPAGKKDQVEKNLPRVQAIVSTGFKTHTVKRGETLDRICRKYGLTKTVVLKSNNLRSSGLKTGQRLRIPYQTTSYEMLPEGSVAKGYLATEAAGGNFILHKIRPGETVSELSRRYGVPIHLIAAWNDINDISRIRAGQQLVFYVQRNENRIAVISTGSSQVKQYTPESNEELINDGSKQYYQVRQGDSLWGIARRFDLESKELRQLNGLSSNVIYPGDRLLIASVEPVKPEHNKEVAKENQKLQQIQVKPAEVNEELPPKGSGQYYQVRKGDSLWGIARRFDMESKELRRLNGLSTNDIYPGDRLLVASSQPAGSEFYYLVRNGDSLWSISRKYNVSTAKIKRWNNLRGNLIHPGNELILKISDTEEPVVDTFYQVRSGDSLWTIARRHNISPEEIRRWNNLKDNTIYPGNRLLLKLASGS